MKVVFIGNFNVPFSTESHHKWTWEQMGHEVIALQEDRTTTEAVLAACRGAQVLQWTHTHGWNLRGAVTPEEMLNQARLMGLKSFSYHLDVYWGLNTLDKRQDRVGTHPSWKVDRFYSTDGAHQAEYEARGVNHCYLPPAVVAYGCFEGTRMPAVASDIGFVGSIGYHPEYPFRKILVDTLKNHYGPRFKTYAGMRETALNNVYASVKVVVGDCCFAGLPYYWSDRLPETCGRGGFLIHPRVKGMTIPVATYEPQKIHDLIQKIDYFLVADQEREAIRKQCFEHVKAHDTYTHRLQFILNDLGF